MLTTQDIKEEQNVQRGLSSNLLNPQQWPTWRKVAIISMVSAIGFSMPFSSSVSSPATLLIMSDFRSHDKVAGDLITSIYVLGTAIGPMILAPASEIWGRNPIFHICTVTFLFFTLACALSQSMAVLIAFRFLAGCAGAAPLAVGGGTIADLVAVEQRGKYIALFSVGAQLGPIMGPVAGGLLTQHLDWRWSFWMVLIIASVITLVSFFVMRETHMPTIKRKQFRHTHASTDMAFGESSPQRTKSQNAKNIFHAIATPMRMLFTSPITLSLAIFQALVYGYMFLLFVTYPIVFTTYYHFAPGSVGLVYISLGIGTASAMAFSSWASDKIVILRAQRANRDPVPEDRLWLMLYGSPLAPAGLILYGWSAQYHLHWVVPLLGSAITGAGILFASLPGNMYMIDTFSSHAASALAAATFLRSIAGGVVPLVGSPMFTALGVGWGSSILAFVALAMCLIPAFLIYFGQRLRRRSADREI
ncbi:MAG: hypothetical protein M1820_007861 [Bogoriella megaspora]|nr:MAG: hypothetical protein M1820_007861 [Bogoriella megaspora]